MNVRLCKLTECCLFKGSARCFWKAKVHKNNFEGEKAAVGDKIPPTYVRKPDRIDKGRKELRTARKELENGYATGSFSVGPDLDQIR